MSIGPAPNPLKPSESLKQCATPSSAVRRLDGMLLGNEELSTRKYWIDLISASSPLAVQSAPSLDNQSTPNPDFQSNPNPDFRSNPNPDFQSTLYPEFQSTPYPDVESTPNSNVQSTTPNPNVDGCSTPNGSTPNDDVYIQKSRAPKPKAPRAKPYSTSKRPSHDRFGQPLPNSNPFDPTILPPDVQAQFAQYTAELVRDYKPPRTNLACGTCRARKVKCSGDRPMCESCIKASQDPRMTGVFCEYPSGHAKRKRKTKT